jgi:hypothetical protein
MKKWTLAIAVLALGAVACGDDDNDGNKGDGGASNGDNNGGTNNGGSTNNNGVVIPDGGGGDECPRDEIPDTWDKYEGELTMTQTGFMECQMKCGTDESCFTEANCPGLDLFDECANTNLIACTGASDGECRMPYEDLLCCAAEAGCDGDAGADCVSDNCETELTAVQGCIDTDMDCLQEALISCLVQGRVLEPSASLNLARKLGSRDALLRSLPAIKR